MESIQSTLSIEALAYKVAQGESSVQIADEMMRAWRQVDIALTPLIGHRGVAGLYQRSLHVTGTAYPWLATCYKGLLHEMNLDDLNVVLAQQTTIDTANASGMLLQTFYDLLGSLIGPELTARLLQAVWISSAGSVLVQDLTP